MGWVQPWCHAGSITPWVRVERLAPGHGIAVVDTPYSVLCTQYSVLSGQCALPGPVRSDVLTINRYPLQTPTNTERKSPTPLRHGLAHPIHNFGVAGGLRRPYVSVHPRLPDKDKTAHSSPRSRQLGKMLVVLRDGRKLFGVLRSYDQFGTHYAYCSCLWGLDVPLTVAS